MVDNSMYDRMDSSLCLEPSLDMINGKQFNDSKEVVVDSNEDDCDDDADCDDDDSGGTGNDDDINGFCISKLDAFNCPDRKSNVHFNKDVLLLPSTLS